MIRIVVGSIVLLVTMLIGWVWLFGAKAKARLAAKYPAPGKLVDVGGYRLHLNCQGQGGPTVVMESGNGNFSLNWGRVPREVAKFTRVCTYDRAGLGWSDRSPQPRTAHNLVADLHTLLARSGVEPPYVLVGHSLGGMLMRLYAHEHPDQVVVPERTRATLHRLAGLPDLDLAVLSGRRLDDLERQFNGGRLFLAGAGGLESRDEHGRRQVHLPADTHLPEPLRESLETWCAGFPGAWVEDKRFSYALHYRAVPSARQPAFGAGVRRRARPFRGQAQLVHGKRVFEIMPAVPWEKSAALGLWLDTRASRGTLIYFGDDTNDEPVHRLVRGRGGIAVAVGRAVSAAEYGLPAPEEVVWFLEWLEREWTAQAAAREAAPQRETVGA